MCLLRGLDKRLFCARRPRPFQKALVGQVPTALSVYLLYRPSADDPLLLHRSLLDEHRLPEGYHIVQVLCHGGEVAAATSSGVGFPNERNRIYHL